MNQNITKRFNFILLLIFLGVTSAYAQSTIRYQGYDGIGDNWSYTSNPGDGIIGITSETFDTSSYSLRMRGSDEENSDPNIVFDNVVNLQAYTNITLTVSFASKDVDNGDDLYMDISYNGGATYGTSQKLIDGTNDKTVSFGTSDVVANPYVFNVPNSATQIRVRFRFDENSNDDNEGDFYYIDTVHLEGIMKPSEIDVQGNSVSIADNDLTPSTIDGTDFGNEGVGNSLVKTFTILNTGAGNLLLTGTPIVAISGSGDFTVSSQPITSVIANTLSTTFEVTYTPSGIGTSSADISIANSDSNENPYNFRIQGTGVTPNPEIDVQGLGTSIVNNDVTPTIIDNTDFGNVFIGGGSKEHIFNIINTGPGALNLTGTPMVQLTGSPDFNVTVLPGSPVTSNGGTTAFRITYTPSAIGTASTVVTILNNDGNESTYSYTIQGTGTIPPPTAYCEDFNTGSGGWNLNQTTTNGNWRRGTDGTLPSTGSSYLYTRQYSNRYRNDAINIAESPVIDLSGYENLVLSVDIYHKTETNYDRLQISFSNDGGTTWYRLGYSDPEEGVNWYNTNNFGSGSIYGWSGNSGTWFTAQLDLESQAFDNMSDIRFRIEFISDGSSTDVGVALDNFCITGEAIDDSQTLICGPGGVSQDLALWLRPDNLALTDGDLVTVWPDSAFGTTWLQATAATATGQQPTFRDNTTNNINGNPVVEFDGDDSMHGKKGFYNQSLYVVFNPHSTVNSTLATQDVFCGDDYIEVPATQDITGVNIGDTSARFTNDLIAYNQGPNTKYGKAIVSATYSYDLPIIFNVRVKEDGSGVDLFIDGVNLQILGNIEEANVAEFRNILNSQWWLGRSEYWGVSRSALFDGDILEVISYSERNTDEEKNRIESYLAVKYGVNLGFHEVPELGVPHIPGEFTDSGGTALWDKTINIGYTYNVSGIGRDDCSGLNQKESKSVEPNAVVKIGLGDIYGTNNANPNNFNDDLDFLMWGSNSEDLTARVTPLSVNLGPSTVTTITDITKRIWKVTERATVDIDTVKIQVPTDKLTNLPPLAGNDAYVMIIADDDAFTTNLETVFLETNGTNQEAFFDFDGTRYFAFGVAHEVIEKRHMTFDGLDDYILVGDKVDVSGGFTMTSWVRTTGANLTSDGKTIVAKHNGTRGYRFRLLNSNHVQFFIDNGGGTTDNITSTTTIPTGRWHNVAVTFDGTTANLYIDGVLDTSKALTTPTVNPAYFTIGAAFENKSSIIEHFMGDLDEIKIFDSAISQSQIQYMMNQEIEQSGIQTNGSVIPNTIAKNDIAALNWSRLMAYYSMNSYIGTHLNDVSENGNRGSLVVPDKFSIETQTSPLPYESNASGTWANSSTWKDGSVQYIPGTASIVDPNITIDWNIVKTTHNVEMDNNTLPSINDENRTLLGLFINANELTVNSDQGLTVSHYFRVDGTLDLEHESQLIQGADSELDVASAGSMEQDQQGTADSFTYNFWSAPVSTISTLSNNNGYTIAGVLRDGTNPSALQSITFSPDAEAADGVVSTPITLSAYWMYRFKGLDSDYNSWVHIAESVGVLTGEGYTMKGSGAGTILQDQNYAFIGKPNNGDIDLSINANSNYLVGNPYPSAIDGRAFIMDNPNTDGTIYLWEHWGGGSHILGEYQGGYALINLSGEVQATSHASVNAAGTSVKIPQRYLPVGQGFFVVGDTNGSVHFKNRHRIYVKESSGNSIFMRGNATPEQEVEIDDRPKLRIGFDSPNSLHRQILATVDANTTFAWDWGYDGSNLDDQIDDMYWLVGNEKYIIQGIPEINENTVLPLGVKTASNGDITIGIDALENISSDVNIYLYDNLTTTFYDLRVNTATLAIDAGEIQNRFFIVFSQQTLGVEAQESIQDFNMIYLDESEKLILIGEHRERAKKITLHNMLGQEIQSFKVEIGTYEFPIKHISSGIYLATVSFDTGSITKKIIRK